MNIHIVHKQILKFYGVGSNYEKMSKKALKGGDDKKWLRGFPWWSND